MEVSPRSDDDRTGEPVGAESLARALAPYRAECRFVVRAWVQRTDPPRIEAELAIPAPYYIDDTGHFNSVEFNLCAEQLLVVLHTAIGNLPAAGVQVDRIQSTFHRAMHAARFWGALDLRDAERGGTIAHVAFRDAAGRTSSGTMEMRA